MNEEKRPLNEQIQQGISKSEYTVHDFAQQMNIKLKVLESYIDGSVIPEKKTLSKMNKFLKTKMKLTD
tara:strand:+ start:404 stop:607 length:204 start_codon:yes stop_codon:yes gene_type:complete